MRTQRKSNSVEGSRGGPRLTVQVRVVCSFAERVRRMLERDRIGEAEATKRVRELGSTIERFMKHHFGHDVTAPYHYDLIVNSGELDVAQATELLTVAYQAKFRRRRITVAPPRSGMLAATGSGDVASDLAATA